MKVGADDTPEVSQTPRVGSKRQCPTCLTYRIPIEKKLVCKFCDEYTDEEEEYMKNYSPLTVRDTKRSARNTRRRHNYHNR